MSREVYFSCLIFPYVSFSHSRSIHIHWNKDYILLCVYILCFYSIYGSSAPLDIVLGILHVTPSNVCVISNNKKIGTIGLEDTVQQHVACLYPHRAVCFFILLWPFDLYLNLYPQYHQDSENSSGFGQREVLGNAITSKNEGNQY